MGVSRGRSRTDGRLDFIQAGDVAQVRLMGVLDHHGVPPGHGADDVAARAFAVGIHMPRQAAPADHCLCSMVLRPVERLVFSPKER